MKASDPQMKIRLPEKLRDLVAAAAEQNKRSMNAEVVDRLDLSFIHEVEGRKGDVNSLRNEVMELRYAMLSMVQAFMSKEQGEIAEAVGKMLDGYQAALEEIKKQGEDAHARTLKERS